MSINKCTRNSLIHLRYFIFKNRVSQSRHKIYCFLGIIPEGDYIKQIKATTSYEIFQYFFSVTSKIH